MSVMSAHVRRVAKPERVEAARPVLYDRLADGSRRRIDEFIDGINKNWPANNVSKRATEVKSLSKNVNLRAEPGASSSKGVTALSVLKEVMPYFPLLAAKILRLRGGYFKESVHEGIQAAVANRLASHAGGGGLRFSARLNRLNEGVRGGEYSTSLFIPHHAVKEVYTPELIADLVNAGGPTMEGVRVERIIEWSKDSEHVVSALLKLEKEKKLKPSAVQNLRELGY